MNIKEVKTVTAELNQDELITLCEVLETINITDLAPHHRIFTERFCDQVNQLNLDL